MGFIQTILMPIRQQRTQSCNWVFKRNLHIFFKAFWHWNFVQNTFVYQVSSMLSYFLSFSFKKAKIFHELYPVNPPPRLHYEFIVELTAPWDPHLHFTTFENSILIHKTDISKTAWINPRSQIWVVFSHSYSYLPTPYRLIVLLIFVFFF